MISHPEVWLCNAATHQPQANSTLRTNKLTPPLVPIRGVLIALPKCVFGINFYIKGFIDLMQVNSIEVIEGISPTTIAHQYQQSAVVSLPIPL